MTLFKPPLSRGYRLPMSALTAEQKNAPGGKKFRTFGATY
jgi:hypothetical protein